MTMITLHLVRHGETPGNAERRFQTPDVPLSDRGREQAAAVARTLREVARSAELVLSSDYARAMETARIIANELALPVLPEPALRERNFGIARGRLYSEFADETLALWRDPHYRIEGGESWADVHERVAAFFAKLRQGPPAREIIAVSHGGAISVMLHHLDGGSPDAFEVQALENCAVRTVTLPAA
jgi:broad specificity phosphatase PhoE